MTDSGCDFAVIGATPLAALLAGLLAGTHGKRVALVGALPSSYLPQTGIDLSIGLLTRPETWALLAETTPQVLELLRALGRGTSRRVDPRLSARTAEGAAALSHVRFSAAGFGHQIEQLASPAIATYRLRDAVLLERGRLGPQLFDWCAQMGVRVVPPAQASLRRDGTARIELCEGALEASAVILADDAAIAAELGPNGSDWLPGRAMTSFLLASSAAFAAIEINADSGVVFSQPPGGLVTAITPGVGDGAAARVGAALDGRAVRRAGQVRFVRFSSPDGGPLVGTGRGLRAHVIAGLGPIGAFLAPALARHFAGVPTDSEARWLEQRGVGKTRGAVAEFAIDLTLETA